MFDDAEEIVLGQILIGALTMAEVSKVLQPVDFLKVSTRHVYEAMLALHEQKESVDIITVSGLLKNTGQQEGPEYIVALSSHVAVERPAFCLGVVRDRSAWAHRKMDSL